MVKVAVYMRPTCPFCIRARDLLLQKQVRFEEINISGSQQLRDKMIHLSGRRTVPQIFVGDEHIGVMMIFLP